MNMTNPYDGFVNFKRIGKRKKNLRNPWEPLDRLHGENSAIKYPCSRMQLCQKSEPVSTLRWAGGRGSMKGRFCVMVSHGQAGGT